MHAYTGISFQESCVPHGTTPQFDLPDFVVKYCDDMKTRYVQQSDLPDDDWPPSLGGDYIRMALIKQQRLLHYHTPDSVIKHQIDYTRGDYDKIMERKIKIELINAFEKIVCEGGSELVLRMLIDGAPGVGKTTLSRKVSSMWANGEILQRYWLVLLLHLRENDISKAKTIDEFFYHDDSDLQQSVIKYVKERNGDGVLIIFDGFDELSSYERSEKSLFLDICRGKILHKCAVAITSRPYASRSLQVLPSINRHIEVLGFTDEQVEVCIMKKIKDQEKARELCTELKDRLDIASICQIPLNCSIVLYVYEQEHYRLPRTLTELYELFILHSLKRFLGRNQSGEAADELLQLDQLPSPYQNYFLSLCELALKGLEEDKLVFSKQDLDAVFPLECRGSHRGLPVLDLMTSAKSYSTRGSQAIHSFLHLTIQEFLAAYQLARYSSDGDKLKFCQENLMENRYRMVLLFLSGLTKLEFPNVSSVFSQESWNKDKVHICHLTYEAGNQSVCRDIAENHSSYRSVELTGSRFDKLVVSDFVANSDCQWKEVEFKPNDSRLIHKVFSTHRESTTSINNVSVTFDCKEGDVDFAPVRLLDGVPQVSMVTIVVDFTGRTTKKYQAFSLIKNMRDYFTGTEAVHNKRYSVFLVPSIGYLSPQYCNILEQFCEMLGEYLVQSTCITQIMLGSVSSKMVQYILASLSQKASVSCLENLSCMSGLIDTPKRHAALCVPFIDFCTATAKVISQNTSLKKLVLDVFSSCSSCYGTINSDGIDKIVSALKHNPTLQKVTFVQEKILFERNQETRVMELKCTQYYKEKLSLIPSVILSGSSKRNVYPSEAPPAKRPRSDYSPPQGGSIESPSEAPPAKRPRSDYSPPQGGSIESPSEAPPAKRPRSDYSPPQGGSIESPSEAPPAKRPRSDYSPPQGGSIESPSEAPPAKRPRSDYSPPQGGSIESPSEAPPAKRPRSDYSPPQGGSIESPSEAPPAKRPRSDYSLPPDVSDSTPSPQTLSQMQIDMNVPSISSHSQSQVFQQSAADVECIGRYPHRQIQRPAFIFSSPSPSRPLRQMPPSFSHQFTPNPTHNKAVSCKHSETPALESGWAGAGASHISHAITHHHTEAIRPPPPAISLPCVSSHYQPREPGIVCQFSLPDFVVKYCNDVKTRYIQQSILPDSDWPPSLGMDGRYINLALLRQERQLRNYTYESVTKQQKDYNRGDYDKIVERKTKIQLIEAFDRAFCDGGSEIVLRMLIDGAPGVGKTTLSRRVSSMWAKGEILQRYWLVLLLHLREEAISKAKKIDEFFYHDDPKLQQRVAEYVKERSGDGVLIIFDGFDELSSYERTEKSLFLDISKGKILHKCAVAITSRPYASRSLQVLPSVNRHIEVLGFTDEKVEMYIKEKIIDQEKAEELCTELKDRLDVASICHIPLNCSIVLYVYEQENYYLPRTLTELYELFILHSLKRFLIRTQNDGAVRKLSTLKRLKNPLGTHFSYLCKLSFEGLRDDKLVFTRDELEQVFPSEYQESDMDLPVLDLMTSAKSYSSRGAQDTYSFRHLTIQEFLAAYWIAQHLSDDDKLCFLQQNLTENRFRMILLFLSGLTKLEFPSLSTAFSEQFWLKEKNYICHLTYEAGNHFLCKDIAENCCNLSAGLEIKFSGTSNFDTLVVSNFVAHSKCQWKRVEVRPSDVRIVHKMFSSEMLDTSIETLSVIYNSEKFNENVSLVPIYLLDVLPQVSSVSVVFEVLGTTNAKSVQLMIKHLKESFTRPQSCHNKDYSIHFKRADYIVSEHCYKIMAQFCETIAECVVQNAHVKEVILDIVFPGNVINIITRLNPASHLERLKCTRGYKSYYRDITFHDFCTTVASVISRNTSLKELVFELFYSGEIDDRDGIDAIESALNHNTTLQKLTFVPKQLLFERNQETRVMELKCTQEYKKRLSLTPSVILSGLSKRNESPSEAPPAKRPRRLSNRSSPQSLSDGTSASTISGAAGHQSTTRSNYTSHEHSVLLPHLSSVARRPLSQCQPPEPKQSTAAVEESQLSSTRPSQTIPPCDISTVGHHSNLIHDHDTSHDHTVAQHHQPGMSSLCQQPLQEFPYTVMQPQTYRGNTAFEFTASHASYHHPTDVRVASNQVRHSGGSCDEPVGQPQSLATDPLLPVSSQYQPREQRHSITSIVASFGEPPQSTTIASSLEHSSILPHSMLYHVNPEIAGVRQPIGGSSFVSQAPASRTQPQERPPAYPHYAYPQMFPPDVQMGYPFPVPWPSLHYQMLPPNQQQVYPHQMYPPGQPGAPYNYFPMPWPYPYLMQPPHHQQPTTSSQSVSTTFTTTTTN